MQIANSLLGTLHVEFINGKVYELEIAKVITDGNGHPIILVGANTVMYNWNLVLAARNVSTPEQKAAFN